MRLGVGQGFASNGAPGQFSLTEIALSDPEVRATRTFALLIAVGFICCLTVPANAQEQTSPGTTQPEAGAKVLGTVVHGNTTIVFESAGTRGIDSQRLMTWDRFAEEHPKIAATLEYKPDLISDSGYLAKHSALATFLQSHPDIRDAMQENPGNFVAIPPRPGE